MLFQFVVFSYPVNFTYTFCDFKCRTFLILYVTEEEDSDSEDEAPPATTFLKKPVKPAVCVVCYFQKKKKMFICSLCNHNTYQNPNQQSVI